MSTTSGGAPGSSALTLDQADYPALFQTTDRSAIENQRTFYRASKVKLIALIAAAMGGALAIPFGRFDLAGLLAMIAFVVALGAETYLLVTKPQQDWFEARAAAESAKTLAWRYSVKGQPFGEPQHGNDREVDRQYSESVQGVLHDLKRIPRTFAVSSSVQISHRMREMRAQPLEGRISSYKAGRLEDQLRWYGHKSDSNGRLAHRWALLAIAFEFGGLAAATVKAFDVAAIDLLGVVSAVAAGIGAWAQSNQYDNNRKAYFIAAQELAAINSAIATVTTEDAWAEFVDSAEEAISREHTLWRASRE